MNTRRCGIGRLAARAALAWAGATLAFGAPAVVFAGSETTVPEPEGASPSTTVALPESEPDELPAAAGPLVPVPAGCAQPAPATLVFEGRVAAVSENAARFDVERVLAGSAQEWEVAPGTLDVVYGDERRFIEVGERYVVGASFDLVTRQLVSAVRAPEPMFGGDAVVGIDDSDVECPRLEDPVRTLRVDGAAVDSGVLTPLDGQGPKLLRAVLLPLGVAFIVLVSLVLLKQTIFAVGRSLRDLGAPAPARAQRTRRHRAKVSAAAEPQP